MRGKNLKARNSRLIREAYAEKQVRVRSTPRLIQLEHTSVCQLQCIGCPHFYQQGRHGAHLNFEVVERIKEILPTVEQIHLSGGGEPFIAEGLADALQVYKQHGIRVSTTTNLMYVDDRAAELIKHFIAKLNISCDGASAATFEGIRRRGSFDVFLRNVRGIREMCPHVELVMGVTLFRQNLHELPDIISLAHQLDFDRVFVGWMIPRPRDMPHTVRDDPTKFPQLANAALQAATKRAAQLGMEVALPLPVQHNGEQESLQAEQAALEAEPFFPSGDYHRQLSDDWWARFKHRPDIHTRPRPRKPIKVAPPDELVGCQGPCDWLYENVFINTSGDVATCTQMPLHSLGNVLDHSSFSEIWNGEAMVALRQAYWDGFVPHHCYGCQGLVRGVLPHATLSKAVAPENFKAIRFE